MKDKFLLLIIIFCCIFPRVSLAQTISGTVNSYARVVTLNSSTRTLTIDNVSGSTTDFAVGRKVLIIQMQGVSVNTTNTASFGNITAYNNAGNYEFALVQSFTGSSAPFTVVLQSLTNAYTVSDAVQILSVPQYTNVTVNGTVTGAAWDAALGRGGIISFEVQNTLTLAANIDASNLGFVGGVQNTVGGGGCGNSITYASDLATVANAQKGAAVAAYPAGQNGGRGALANGGGGGNDHNGGGGGGGNLGSGGNGGMGWPGAGTCSGSADPPRGSGIGGNGLVYNPITNKIFMGGGGGSGQQNNGVASNGARGGGLIIVRAGTVTTNCVSTWGILSNGQNATNSPGNDGAGGGGAGGTILLDVVTYTLPCAIAARSNGGNGGTVGNSTAHGGGGGGGVGAILVNTNPPAPAVFSSTVGAAGLDCNAGGCVATGQPGNPCPSGNCTSTGWLVPGTLTALPITMASFTAKVVESNKVQLDWVTLTEEDVERFVIVKTRDFKNLFQVGQVTTTGNSNQRKSYQMMDNSAWNGTSYYLVQTIEKDGSVTSSNWISVELNNPQITMTVFPNPATEEIRINLSQNNGADKFIYLFDANGQMVWQEQFRQSDGYVLRRNGLPNGVYILRLVIDMDIITQKIVFN